MTRMFFYLLIGCLWVSCGKGDKSSEKREKRGDRQKRERPVLVRAQTDVLEETDVQVNNAPEEVTQNESNKADNSQKTSVSIVLNTDGETFSTEEVDSEGASEVVVTISNKKESEAKEEVAQEASEEAVEILAADEINLDSEEDKMSASDPCNGRLEDVVEHCEYTPDWLKTPEIQVKDENIEISYIKNHNSVVVVWKDGVWENGIWQKGLWENGVWENGEWIAGIWTKGIWENGVWNGGLWQDGQWKGGEWKGGVCVASDCEHASQ